MAARPVFADLPETTAYPPTADDLKKAHKVGTEYRHIADVYNPVAPEFKQNQSAAELYAVAVENLAATKYLTPTPGEGQGGVPEPVQPGPTFLALQAAGIGGPSLILATALDGLKEDLRGLKEDLRGVKEDVKTIKRDVELVKRRQQDVKGGVSALKAQSVKNGKRVRSLKTRMDRPSATHNVSEAQRQRAFNASLRTVPGAPLVVVTGPDGTAPPRAIKTLAQINALTGQQLKQLLEFYHLPIDQLVADRRNCLQAFLYGESLATEPSPYPQGVLEAEEEGIWDSDEEEEEDEALWDDEEQERLWREADEEAAAGRGAGGEA
ncbi:hypothetical protein NBRC10513v2_005268 [Rhodotorula toruloides]